MKRMIETESWNKGFTMIEVVVVLVVLFIVSAVFISRYTTADSNELIAEVDTLKANLRFAQIRAMNDTVSWGINFANPTSYTLIKSGGAAPNLPGDNNPTHMLANGVTASGVSTVAFNEWGTPIDGAGIPLNTNIRLTMSKGSQSSTVTITKNTGFIQ